MPAYASWGELRAPEQRAEDAQALVEQGFRAVKIRIARDRIDEGVAVVGGGPRGRRRAARRSWSTSTSGGGWRATSSAASARPRRGA